MPTKQIFPHTQSRRVFGHSFRVGLYARVSTHDQQTLPLQIRSMREYAAKRGWSVVAQIKEIGSGASQRELRETLTAAARRREIDGVLVWRLDRWGRSVADLVSTLQELQHLDVGFVSLTEALDLTTPAGRAMAGLLARSDVENYLLVFLDDDLVACDGHLAVGPGRRIRPVRRLGCRR